MQKKEERKRRKCEIRGESGEVVPTQGSALSLQSSPPPRPLVLTLLLFHISSSSFPLFSTSFLLFIQLLYFISLRFYLSVLLLSASSSLHRQLRNGMWSCVQHFKCCFIVLAVDQSRAEERNGKERTGKERSGKERSGKERKVMQNK